MTGCTDGIGKAFCEELAKKKIKVFLISRTEAKLKELAAELKSKYKAETNYAVVDFAEAGDDEYACAVPPGIVAARDAVDRGCPRRAALWRRS